MSNPTAVNIGEVQGVQTRTAAKLLFSLKSLFCLSGTKFWARWSGLAWKQKTSGSHKSTEHVPVQHHRTVHPWVPKGCPLSGRAALGFHPKTTAWIEGSLISGTSQTPRSWFCTSPTSGHLHSSAPSRHTEQLWPARSSELAGSEALPSTLCCSNHQHKNQATFPHADWEQGKKRVLLRLVQTFLQDENKRETFVLAQKYPPKLHLFPFKICCPGLQRCA